MEWGGSVPSGPLGEEDVEELRSERSIRGLKSAEELERLTVDENLGEIERAVLLLSTGLEIQKLSVIENLPKLLETNNSDVVRKVIPLLREFLYIAPIHIQLESSKIFQRIIEMGIVQVYVFASSFLPIILHNIENRDIAIANTWLEALLTSISYLPKDVIKREVLGVAVSKGQLSQSVNSRLASCKLLGEIAPKFDHFWIKKELMSLVTSLCQDVDYEVRACMCMQLEHVAKAVGLEATKTSVIPELVELTNDEETNVRLAGLETVTNLLTLLDDDTCTVVIVPLVRKFCENIPTGDYQNLKTVAKLFGKLCYGLSVNFNESQRKWFLEYYRNICHCGNPSKQSNRVGSVTLALQLSSGSSTIRIEDDDEAECRRCCAFNFPAMVLFAGPTWFKTELASTFHSLVEDPHALVRRTVACGFHEVAKLLGANVGVVQQDLGILLKDESIEVLQGLIQNLPESLECLACGGHTKLSDTKLNNLSDLIPSLIACELAVASSSNWRLHVEILEKFSCFPKCLTSDQIYYKFVPLLFRLLSSNRVLPVKLAAARTLCIFIRYNRRFEQRQELCCRLIQECGRGKSYRSRQLFIDICKFIMELFSRNFFKENFFEFLLELASDPVINVRLKFCSVLPSLKSVLKLPSNRQLLQQLEQCVRRLVTSEQEPDVSAAIREAVMKLDKIEIIMETLSRRTMFENDLLDQKKEEEERQLIATEEKDREEMAGGRQGSELRKKGTQKEDRSCKKGSKAVKSSRQETHAPVKRTSSNKDASSPSLGKQTQKLTASKVSAGSKSSLSPSLQKLPSMATSLPPVSPTNLNATGSYSMSRRPSPIAITSNTGSTKSSSKGTNKTTGSGTSSKNKKTNSTGR